MKRNSHIFTTNSTQSELKRGQHKKWPAQSEQTMYINLTIGSKDDPKTG